MAEDFEVSDHRQSDPQEPQVHPAANPPLTLTACIGNYDAELAHAGKVLEGATAVADRLLGASSLPDDRGDAPPETANMLQAIQQRNQHLSALLELIEAQVTRIGNSL